jgi:hypothetical protein
LLFDLRGREGDEGELGEERRGDEMRGDETLDAMI